MDGAYDPMKEILDNRPTNLTGKLLLGAEGSHSQWLSLKQKVTNVNIFASGLSTGKMQRMTSGGDRDCGEEGDFLAWSDAEWTLHGEAIREEVEAAEPCEAEPDFNIYNAYFPGMEDCMEHCTKLGARVPSVVTMEEWQRLREFMMKELYNKGHSNKVYGFWISATDGAEEGVWRDAYTGERMLHDGPFTGGGPNGGEEESCALQVTEDYWHDWTCKDPCTVV